MRNHRSEPQFFSFSWSYDASRPVKAIRGGALHGIQYPLSISDSSWPSSQQLAPTKKENDSIPIDTR